MTETSHRRMVDVFSAAHAAGYVLSGCCQPLLLQLIRTAGLADAKAQLYMWFYYMGPALVLVPFFFTRDRQYDQLSTTDRDASPPIFSHSDNRWPSRRLVWRAIAISLFDTVSASMNYAGASLAGPTIFAIVYSSVTIWTAIFSRLILNRKMNATQWSSVGLVFFGLTVTATESQQMGPSVYLGCLLIVFGSAMHAMTYVFCEAIMTMGTETLSLSQNCGIQAGVACSVLGVWQTIYTIPHWKEVIAEPMKLAGTSWGMAMCLLILFAFCNWVHSITFYRTLIQFPGGATSAGVMKGLQAVLVFVFTDLAFCGKTGGKELCFTNSKFASLVLVVAGVIIYGVSTNTQVDQRYTSVQIENLQGRSAEEAEE